jgi:hypothetical protein
LTRVNDAPADLPLVPEAVWDLSRWAQWPADKTVPSAFPPKPRRQPTKPWKLRSVNGAAYDLPATNTNWAIDGDPATCWCTREGMQPGDWLEIDLGQARALGGVRCDHRGSPTAYPRGVRVEASTDGKSWQCVAELAEPEVVRAMQEHVLTVPFRATARYLRLVQLGHTRDTRWSIYDLDIVPA